MMVDLVNASAPNEFLAGTRVSWPWGAHTFHHAVRLRNTCTVDCKTPTGNHVISHNHGDVDTNRLEEHDCCTSPQDFAPLTPIGNMYTLHA